MTRQITGDILAFVAIVMLAVVLLWLLPLAGVEPVYQP